MRREYQDYWRRGEEDEEEPEKPWTRSLRFRLADGSSLLVTVEEAEAVFSTGNGATRRVPLSDLRYCPTCVTEGNYPFFEGEDSCPKHGALLYFNVPDFETFEMVAFLRNSKDI